jgi:hypothetical protein
VKFKPLLGWLLPPQARIEVVLSKTRVEFWEDKVNLTEKGEQIIRACGLALAEMSPSDPVTITCCGENALRAEGRAATIRDTLKAQSPLSSFQYLLRTENNNDRARTDVDVKIFSVAQSEMKLQQAKDTNCDAITNDISNKTETKVRESSKSSNRTESKSKVATVDAKVEAQVEEKATNNHVEGYAEAGSPIQGSGLKDSMGATPESKATIEAPTVREPPAENDQEIDFSRCGKNGTHEACCRGDGGCRIAG